MGYLFAIITSLFFTFYVVPKKLSRQTPIRYGFFQGLGLFAAALVAYIISRLGAEDAVDTLSDPVLLLSCAEGIVWFSASMFFLIAIDKMGLSRANQWKNLQGPFGSMFNIIFLAEYLQINVWFVALASVFMLISAMLFNVKSASGAKVDRSGIVYALLSAVCFGLCSLLKKYVTMTGHIYSQQLCISVFVFISAAVWLFIREKNLACIKAVARRDNILGVAGGVLFFLASFFSLTAYSELPGSVAFTIIQLNSVWTALVGILLFREIAFAKNRLRILAGFAAAVAGVLMLLLANG